jgi:hypothetical protein
MACGTPRLDTGIYFNRRLLALGGDIAARENARLFALCESLLQRQCDFDFIDDEVLLEGTLQEGALHFGDARYAHVLIPDEERLTPKIAARLATLRDAGIGTVPEDVQPLLRITPAAPALRMRLRDLGGGRLGCFLFNTGDTPLRVHIPFPCNEVTEADPLTGSLLPASSDVFFGPAESRCFLCGVSAMSTASRFEAGTPCSVDLRQITLKPLRQFAMEAQDYTQRRIDVPSVPAVLGDWRPFLGDDFSGDALYTAVFTCENPSACHFLDLGEVQYACTVRLNGVDLGRKAWAPFRFALEGALRDGENTLEVIVTNTLANIFTLERQQYLDTAFPPKSPYSVRETVFEAESMSSGLFGPVTFQ